MRTILINKRLAIVAVTLFSIAAHADAITHRYVVSIDSDLRQLTVDARYGGPVHSVRARSNDAGRFLQQVRDCDTDQRIRVSRQRMLLPDSGVSCIRYSVDLAKAARAERRNATLSTKNVVVSPTAWFWRPAIKDDESILVRFELDDAYRVSVPWQAVADEANTYRLTASPQSSRAPAVFGDFEYHETPINGALLRISILNPRHEFGTAEIVEWVRRTADSISLAYGTFPNPFPNVVVVPVGGPPNGDSPVPFGRVVRDGGETVELFINQNMAIDAYYDDWTATHEFSHLMLPYLGSQHRWISEGFAQYYQNLLMARAGQYTEERAWLKLYEGLERGRRSSPDLSPNEAARDRWGSLMKVYWSGAAIALLADLELRQRSNGTETLDDVLRQFQRCCLPAKAQWSGTRLFRRLDRFTDEPVFMPLYRRFADAPGFPDVRPQLAELGVIIDDGQVRLDDHAPLAALRSAMTAR